MFHCIPGGVPEKLASRVEALILPGGVDVLEKRLTEPEIDLDHLRIIIAVRGVHVGHTQTLYQRIYKSVVRIRSGRHLRC